MEKEKEEKNKGCKHKWRGNGSCRQSYGEGTGDNVYFSIFCEICGEIRMKIIN